MLLFVFARPDFLYVNIPIISSFFMVLLVPLFMNV
jgi:hypothetical protein